MAENRMKKYVLWMMVVVLGVVGGLYFFYSHKKPPTRRSSFTSKIKKDFGPKQPVTLSPKVLRAIDEEFNDRPNEKAAVTQMATFYQRIVEKKDSPELIRNEMSRANDCIIKTMGDDLKPSEIEKIDNKYRALVLDTPAKVRAEIHWNAQWSGQIYLVPWYTEKQACDR